MIFLNDVLKAMEELDQNNNLKPFSIEVVTADRSRRTGGEILSIENAVLTRTSKEKRDSAIQTGSRNHYKNSTRNIKVLGTDQVRCIHIRLITKFNNHQVVY